MNNLLILNIKINNSLFNLGFFYFAENILRIKGVN